MLAAVGDLPYRIVHYVHLFTAIIAMGAAFVGPLLARRAGSDVGRGAETAIREALGNVIFPMLLVTGSAGGALVGMSDDFWDFSQTWLAIAGAVWVFAMGFAIGAYPPPRLRLFNLTAGRQRMLVGLLHLSMAFMLVLMVWKFGGPAGA